MARLLICLCSLAEVGEIIGVGGETNRTTSMQNAKFEKANRSVNIHDLVDSSEQLNE